jgi:hypothetical protein
MSDTKIINKGTGAGGANTNMNGLSYEAITSLDSEYTITDTTQHSKTITFNNGSCAKYSLVSQAKLFKHMDAAINKTIENAHGCKRPDEGFIDAVNKVVFLLEKKSQQTPGSVCEKIQTAPMKLWQYKRIFPDYTIVYIYSLSKWFKGNCKAELEYLAEEKVPVFWGNSTTYKSDIVQFITNYDPETAAMEKLATAERAASMAAAELKCVRDRKAAAVSHGPGGGRVPRPGSCKL